MQFHEDKLKQVLADVLSTDSKSVDDNTSPDTVPNWDSLRHMQLVLALEAEFDVTFTEQESVEILSYPLIKEVLKEHGITLI